jgi:hypothetical protein
MSAAGKLIYVFSRVLRHSHRHTHIHMRRAKWADARRREWGGGEIYGLKLNPPTLPPSTMRVRVRGTDTLWTWLRTPALFSFSLCASSAVRLLTPFTPTPAQRRAHTHITLNPAWPGGVCICNLMLPYYNNIIPWRTAFSLVCSVLSAIFHLLHSHNGHACTRGTLLFVCKLEEREFLNTPF